MVSSMQVLVLTPKRIAELKAKVALRIEVALKPQMLTDVENLGNLNAAFNIAGLASQHLKEVPPSTIILTPSAPQAPTEKVIF